jgi:hypothetical protein
MHEIKFIWDIEKNTQNIKKHNVSFEEAKTVFYDENARVIFDPDHSQDEERFIIIGMSKKLNILIVSHCYRSNDEIIRIISARKATSKETNYYTEVLK